MTCRRHMGPHLWTLTWKLLFSCSLVEYMPLNAQEYCFAETALRSTQNICFTCFGCLNKPLHWDGSPEYPQHRFSHTLMLKRTISPRGCDNYYLCGSENWVLCFSCSWLCGLSVIVANPGQSKEGKDQELIQSSTTPDPDHHMGK